MEGMGVMLFGSRGDQRLLATNRRSGFIGICGCGRRG
jgi:hypothetical protein